MSCVDVQAELAEERIQKAGLTGRCRVEVCDYRDVNKPNSYEKIVSVEMIEHVGRAMLPTYFRHIWHLLRPGGVFLNHGITSNAATPTHQGLAFTRRYVFPNGELAPISTTLRAAEESGFEVRDVESLREHFVLTQRHWIRRLEDHASEARSFADDVTYRIWRLCMAGAAHELQAG